MLCAGKSRIPITMYLLEALVLTALTFGFQCNRVAEGRKWWGAAIGWWLGFVGLLRPGEVLGLRWRDIVFPSGASDPGVVLVIRVPKTRRVWRTQFVLVEDVKNV